MANELKARGQTAGNTYYALIIDNSNNQYRKSNATFEAYNGANYSSYIYGEAAADAQGDYIQSLPTGPGLPAGSYDIKIRERAGGAGAANDADAVYAYTVTSDGAGGYSIGAGGSVGDVQASVNALQSTVNTLLTYIPAIAPGQIGGLPILDASQGVKVGSIKDDAITTISIQNGAITNAKVADGLLTLAKFATNALDGIRDSVWAKAMTELSAVPAVTASVFDGLRWCFTRLRNKRTAGSNTETLMKDDGTTPLATSSVNDTNGVFTAGKWS